MMRRLILPFLIALCAACLWAAGPQSLGKIALLLGQPSIAADLLEEPGARGVALYRAGRYAEADAAFEKAGRSVTYNRGLSLAATAAAPDVTPVTATLAGKWLTDRLSVLDYPAGSFDEFFRTQLSLTEKGQAAEAAFDSLSAENPEATCVGRPTPSALVSTTRPCCMSEQQLREVEAPSRLVSTTRRLLMMKRALDSTLCPMSQYICS